jgi:hypothetical protein
MAHFFECAFMSLSLYKQKRYFESTPELTGGKSKFNKLTLL